jgi:hypothetical protein
VREDPAGWRSTDHGLEIRVQPGNMWGGANDARNVLVRDVPDPVNPEGHRLGLAQLTSPPPNMSRSTWSGITTIGTW